MTSPSITATVRRTALDTADSSAGVALDALAAHRAADRVGRCGASAGPGHRARRGVRRPARRRADPRPVRRRQRGPAALDRQHRLVVPRPPSASSPGREQRHDLVARRSRHRRHRAAERHRDRPHRQPAPQLPVRRHRPCCVDGRQRPRGRASRARSPAPTGCPPSSASDRARTTHPFNAIRKMAAGYGWDWGTDLRRRRHLEVDRHRVLERGPAGLGPAAGPASTVPPVGWRPTSSWSGPTDAEPVEVAATIAGQTRHCRCRRPGSPRSCSSSPVPDVELWWPVGYGAQTPLRRDGRGRPASRCARRGRLPHRRAVDRARRARHRVRARGQRRARLRQGLQLDPRRRACSPG